MTTVAKELINIAATVTKQLKNTLAIVARQPINTVARQYCWLPSCVGTVFPLLNLLLSLRLLCPLSEP